MKSTYGLNNADFSDGAARAEQVAFQGLDMMFQKPQQNPMHNLNISQSTQPMQSQSFNDEMRANMHMQNLQVKQANQL